MFPELMLNDAGCGGLLGCKLKRLPRGTNIPSLALIVYIVNMHVKYVC